MSHASPVARTSLPATCLNSRDGTLLSYRHFGAGTPVVLIHGTATDGRRWLPVLPALESHFAVYALDRRGYGDSGDATCYSIETEFDDIAALADAIGQGPIDIVAHSYGALCALGAARNAGLVRRLVIYEPPLPTQPGAYFEPSLLAAMRAAIACDDSEAAAAAFAENILGWRREELESMRHLRSWETLVGYASHMLRELENVERLSYCPEIFWERSVPTLILAGGDSPPQHWATAQALHTHLPSSRIAILANQRHSAINMAPDLFAREVIGFLTAPQISSQAK